MEELLLRHRQEKKALQGKISQKKKSATKKTRKGVNDECDRMETKLVQAQDQEIAALKGLSINDDDVQSTDSQVEDVEPDENANEDKHLTSSPKALSVPVTGGSRQAKPNRAKARLARRAAEQVRIAEEAAVEAENLPDLQAQEKHRMAAILKQRGLVEKEVRADGHCLYAATADQILQRGQDLKIGSVLSFQEQYRTVRYVAADFIEKHADDYVPFLEEDLDTYLDKIRDTGEWGGQIELMALSKAYKVKICVVHGDGNVIEIGDGDDDKKIWLAFYKHGYGLGEHYNSLRVVEK